MKNHIFIVDDDLLYTHYIKSLLKFYGDFEVSTFLCGADCLKNLDKNPDLIFLDYDLGESNGIDILITINSLKLDTKVVMVTTHDERSIIDEAYQNGAYSFLKKDLSLGDNIRKIITDSFVVESKIA